MAVQKEGVFARGQAGERLAGMLGAREQEREKYPRGTPWSTSG